MCLTPLQRLHQIRQSGEKHDASFDAAKCTDPPRHDGGWPGVDWRARRGDRATCSEAHHHTVGLAIYRYPGRHRRVAADRTDLRHALHRLALREWREGQEV